MGVEVVEIGRLSKLFFYIRGPKLLGIHAVIAESYERIHRSNLVGMGVLPLQFLENENAEKLGLKGDEVFEIDVTKNINLGDSLDVKTNTGISFRAKVRLDTAPEIEYYKNNGILLYVLRKIIKNN